MKVFKVKSDGLQSVKSESFKNEKELQSLTEKNLKAILDLDFVSTELSIKNFRIDTLAYDSTANSFVIIEYKNSGNFSVIDQGFAYLSLMLNNKADFVLTFNERQNRSLKRSEIDWSQSRVIFISPTFSAYQKEAVNFKDLPIELWEVRRFAEDLVIFGRVEPLYTSGGGRIPGKPPGPPIDVVTYTESDVLKKCSDEIQELYPQTKDQVYKVDNSADKRVTKRMICFYSNSKGLLWIAPYPHRLVVYLRKGTYKDKYKKIKPEGWGGYPEVSFDESDFDLPYVRSLIEQSYSK